MSIDSFKVIDLLNLTISEEQLIYNYNQDPWN